MHINLIIGAIFILVLWWFLRETRSGKNKQNSDPAAMLKDELEKRRVTQENSRRAALRLDVLKKERMDQVLHGLREMIAALPVAEAGHETMSAFENGQAVIMRLKYDGTVEDFILEWNVKNLDLELAADEAYLSDLAGFYTVRLPDGSAVREVEFSDFMRALSGLIADRLA